MQAIRDLVPQAYLGAGTFGTVSLVTRRSTGHHYAMKSIALPALNTPEGLRIKKQIGVEVAVGKQVAVQNRFLLQCETAWRDNFSAHLLTVSKSYVFTLISKLQGKSSTSTWCSVVYWHHQPHPADCLFKTSLQILHIWTCRVKQEPFSPTVDQTHVKCLVEDTFCPLLYDELIRCQVGERVYL